MSNFFQEVKDDATKVKQELLGPDYKYYDQIKNTSELGMSSAGSISQLTKNISGLIGYTEVLVTGQGASKTGGPIGPKFFLKTGAKCKAKDSGKSVTRYVYIDHVPKGNIPFISSGVNSNFSELRGLIPGTLGNMNDLNPFTIFGAFMEGSNPQCRELTMETIDNDNHKKNETQYVTDGDIKNMDPCGFSDKKNPVSGQKCREIFSNIEVEESRLPSDSLIQLYIALLGMSGLYLLYKLRK